MAGQGCVACKGFHFARWGVVDFALKSIDCFAKLLDGGFNGGQLHGMVHQGIVAPLGWGGTDKGFDDVVVGKVEKEVFDRPRACSWEFTVVIDLLRDRSQKVLDAIEESFGRGNI